MNEFIEQFLVECRELVEQATDDLLALEERPAERERLDSAFRGFHTLKGAAGIVEFDAMARALHAAEDGLAAVRAGQAPISAALNAGELKYVQTRDGVKHLSLSGPAAPAADEASPEVHRRPQ